MSFEERGAAPLPESMSELSSSPPQSVSLGALAHATLAKLGHRPRPRPQATPRRAGYVRVGGRLGENSIDLTVETMIT